jgi:hypothetical protein
MNIVVRITPRCCGLWLTSAHALGVRDLVLNAYPSTSAKRRPRLLRSGCIAGLSGCRPSGGIGIETPR